MSDDVSIEFPQADVKRIFAQIQRAQKELGKNIGQAVKFAAWSVAQSLGVKTEVAKKYRPYKQVPEPRGRVIKKGGKKYEVTCFKKGRRNTFMTRAPSVSALKKSPQVRIGNAGLAKAAWMWGIKTLGSSSKLGTKGMTSGARKLGKQHVFVIKRLTGEDPYVKIVNKIRYAGDAMKGGPGEVSSAMGKAARHMERIIDAGIAKKLGAK